MSSTMDTSTTNNNTTETTETTTEPTSTVIAEVKTTKRGRKPKSTSENAEGVTSTEEVTEKKVKEKKEKKEKPPKNYGFMLHTTRDREYQATRFCKYIYDTIKETKPELLMIPSVRDAYNEMFTYMSQSSGTLVTYAPRKSEKYSAYKFTRAITNTPYYNSIAGINGAFTDAHLIYNNYYNNQPQYKERIEKCKKQINELTELWSKLYNLTYPEMSTNLIKANAILQLQLNEQNLKKEITTYKDTIISLSKQIEDIHKQITSYKKKVEEKEGALAKLIVESKKST